MSAALAPNMFNVLLRPVGGRALHLRLDGAKSVWQTKLAIASAVGIPASCQRAILDGEELYDARPLSECRVRNGCTLQLLRRSFGGSAAARAQMAVKRKQERKQMYSFMAAEESSDEDDDMEVDERPECVTNMHPELAQLMSKQMNEFMKKLKDAVEDPGDNQENLEVLEETFDKLLYRGFVEGKGFYPLGHKHEHRAAATHEEEVTAIVQQTQTGIPELAEKVKDHAYFKNFIVFAICLAGLIVGANTYLDCNGVQSCYKDERGNEMWAETEVARFASGGNVSWTEADCRLERGCFEPRNESQVNSTDRCWMRGRMPECAGPEWNSFMETLDVIDNIILVIFTIECFLKIVAEFPKPWRYFFDAWNFFDFFIVLACYMPFMGSNVAVLRLLRLMRLLKLLHTIENLQIILSGLTAGFGSIGYILILLLLVFYLFAIIAIMLFKGNDHVHFKDLDTAMITLFRMSTMEDWTDVMYINMLGCDKYGYGSYCFDRGYACDIENEDGDRVTSIDLGTSVCAECDNMCQTPDKWGYTAAIFFVCFIVISGYVVMSLFIGVITTSMAGETDKHTQMKRAGKQAAAKAKFRAELEEHKNNGTLVRVSDEIEDDVDEDQVFPPHPNAIVEKYLKGGRFAHGVVNSNWFTNFITFCIILAAVLIGAATYKSVEEEWGSTMEFFDNLILLIFSLEILLKFWAAQLKPWIFFYSHWNTFDFAVVAVCLLPFGSDMVAVLRLLRLLRVLKLFKALPQLQIIMSGLAQGMSSIGYIAMLLTLMFYVMGIMAIMFFRENDPVHFGSLHTTFVTLFRCATFEDWTDVMYIAMYGCQMWSFGNAHLDLRCENNKGYGLLGALFFVLFILFSALIMLNLVIGSICSSMSDAQEAYEMQKTTDENVKKVVAKTKVRGREYNLPGVPYKVIEKWSDAFNRMDSASSALALEASIHKDDLETVLEMIGEATTLSTKSLEQIHIRANHTLPIGLIDMMSFIEYTADDLMNKRIKDLAQTTGYVMIERVENLDMNGDDEIDPFVVVTLNGKATGQTHKLSHTGPTAEWHERVTFPAELLSASGKNTFKLEIFDWDQFSNNDLLGTVTLAYEGTDFPRNVEQHAIVLPKRSANGKEMKGSLACQIKAPAASLSGAMRRVHNVMRPARYFAMMAGTPFTQADPAAPPRPEDDVVSPTASTASTEDVLV